jgi:hypothetical protein
MLFGASMEVPLRPNCKIEEPVPSGWQNKLVRLSRMNWDEIRTRVGQEFHKRSELALYRIGRQPAIKLDESPSREPKFFFPRNGAAERAQLLRTHMPAMALEILHHADDIRRHHFRLLGYDDLDYGAEIDWHLDRVHGKRAPMDTWFKIRFLDFAAVGDHKVTWELNRHQHLITLAKAWLLSHDEKYVREIVAQWRSWTKVNPYPIGINWGSSLEAAFRSLSWIWVDQLIAGAPGHAEFHAELLPAIALHGRYIDRYLSTYFSPNTHLLGEAVALCFIGTLYPQIAASSRWQRNGWKILLQEAQRQVRPDGVYFEQSLHYHVYALDFFLYARMLAAKNGLEIPSGYDSTLGKMLGVVRALAQAGPPEGFGDDDGGRVFDPRRNHTENMSDPLAIGSLLFGKEHFSSACLTEESIWLFGQQAIDILPQALSISAPISSAFPDGGIYVLADSAPFPRQIVVDAGPQGIGHSGHGHADALSVSLTMDGRRWLVDAGSGVYISADPADRNAFRQTGAHNTLRVDELDQAQPDGPFSWTAIPEIRTENSTEGKTFTYFSGSHNGYARLADPVTHSRQVVSINGGPTLIRDIALGREDHELELFWHFAPDLEIRKVSEHSFVVSDPNKAGTGRPALDLICPDESTWTIENTRGLISPVYGKYESAPLLRVHTSTRLPAETATLLQTRTYAHAVRYDYRLASMRQAAVQVYEWVETDANHGFCFALDKRPWNFGPWFSDAEFLYCRIAGEKLAHLIVVGGTYVAWQGRELLRAPGPSRFFEWRKQDDLLHSEPDEFSTSPLFYELTGRSKLQSDPSNISSTYAEKP